MGTREALLELGQESQPRTAAWGLQEETLWVSEWVLGPRPTDPCRPGLVPPVAQMHSEWGIVSVVLAPGAHSSRGSLLFLPVTHPHRPGGVSGCPSLAGTQGSIIMTSSSVTLSIA